MYSISETSSAKCECQSGFRGDLCNETVEIPQRDECLSDPCENGGTCHEGINGYSCVCPVGFKGLNCRLDEIDDPCLPNPCHAGTLCKKNDTVSTGYVCQGSIFAEKTDDLKQT